LKLIPLREERKFKLRSQSRISVHSGLFSFHNFRCHPRPFYIRVLRVLPLPLREISVVPVRLIKVDHVPNIPPNPAATPPKRKEYLWRPHAQAFNFGAENVFINRFQMKFPHVFRYDPAIFYDDCRNSRALVDPQQLGQCYDEIHDQ